MLQALERVSGRGRQADWAGAFGLFDAKLLHVKMSNPFNADFLHHFLLDYQLNKQTGTCQTFINSG